MTITLRNVPPDIERAILETSSREGISRSKAALRLLESAIRKPSANSDFEEFFGTWSTSKADDFDANLRAIRRIDAREWQQRPEPMSS